MILPLAAILAAVVLALAGTPLGLAKIHAHKHTRCLANIARLEIELGIRETPRAQATRRAASKYESKVTLMELVIQQAQENAVARYVQTAPMSKAQVAAEERWKAYLAKRAELGEPPPREPRHWMPK